MAGRNLAQSPEAPVIAGFTVLEVLHEGDSATVYLARQDDLARLVALKVIRRRINDPSTRRAFDREVKAVAGLSGHPHVVAIYTTGWTTAGEPFLVTEYADRGSLGDVVATQGALPVGEAVAVGVGMVDGLAAAHAVGIVHGDLKPGNVLLTSTGGVKLADFGLARLLSGASSTAARPAYTPAHVAPEVLMGEPAREPADSYGVASTIVEALTGRPPFGTIGSNEPVTTILRRKLSTEPAPLPADVPPRLQGVLRTALTTDPQRRPRLGALRLALTEAGRQAPDDVPPTAPAPAIPPPVPVLVDDKLVRRKRRRWVPVVAALALLALLIGAGIALTRRGDTSTSGVPTTVASTAAPSTAAPAPASTAPPAAPSTAAPAPASTAPPAPASTAVPTAPGSPVTTTPTTAATPAPAPTTATPATPAPTTVPPPVRSSTLAPATTVDRARLAEDFLRTYYATVAARQYPKAWSMLTPEFQTSTGGYGTYTAFWDTVEGVEVRRVDVQPAKDGVTWPIVATLGMRYTVHGHVTDENDQLTLQPDPAGSPRIADYRVIGGG